MKKIKTILIAILTLSMTFALLCAVGACSDDVAKSGKIDVTDKEITFYIGETYTVKPEYSGELKLVYTSSDETTAEVSADGKITAKTEGTAFITVSDGENSVVMKVTVLKAENYVALNCYDANVVVGNVKEIKAVVYEKGAATEKTVEFSVSPNDCEMKIVGNKLTFSSNAAAYYTITAKCGDLQSICTIKTVNANARFLSLPEVTVEHCDTVKWNAVEGATSYAVAINGGEWTETTETAYSVASLTHELKVGETAIVSVKALAKSDFNYLDGFPKGVVIEHDYRAEAVVAYSCSVAGTVKYTCSVCDLNYTIENYTDPHTIKDGKCEVCGDVVTKAVTYLYNEEKQCYYVAGPDAGFDSETVYFLSEYDDGKNGKHPVSYVGQAAFQSNSKIKKVIMPESITELYGLCFEACSSLEYVSMKGITYLPAIAEKNYEHNNFRDCYNLKYVIVGDGFNNVGRNWMTWKNVPKDFQAQCNVYVYGDVCKGLYTSQYPINITTGGNNALLTGQYYIYDETSDACLRWHYAEDGETVVTSGEHRYTDGVCDKCGAIDSDGIVYKYDIEKECYYVSDNRLTDKTEINVLAEYNDGINGIHPVSYIENSAFNQNKKIVKVVLPESITKLGYSTFEVCSNLESVYMPGVTEIDSGDKNNKINLFLRCDKLKEIFVNPNLTVARKQFVTDSKGYEAQIKVYILGSADNVNISADNNNMITKPYFVQGSGTCQNCWTYDEDGNVITSLKSTDHIYVDGVCMQCGGNRTANLVYEYDGENNSYAVAGYTGAETELYIACRYDDGVNGLRSVTAVKKSAFSGKSKLTKIVLPDSVTFVGGEAFFNCSALKTLIMSGVVKINQENTAYNLTNGCNSLTTLVINGNLDMGRKVFYSDKASGITTVYLTSANNLSYTPAGATSYTDSNNTLFNGKFYEYDGTKTACNTWAFDENGEIITTGEHAFADGACGKCGKDLTEGLAYTYNANLGGYVVSKGTCSATEIYVRATYNDDTNGEKRVVAIASGAFQNNTKITKVILPTSVTHIGYEAFFGCTKLETVIMSGVTSFYKVGDDGAILVSDPTKAAGASGDIGLNVFHNCNALKIAVVSNSVNLDRKTFSTASAEVDKIDLYVYGANADNIKVRNDSSNGNNLFSGKYIFYSETKIVGCWHYDESGEPVLWSE